MHNLTATLNDPFCPWLAPRLQGCESFDWGSDIALEESAAETVRRAEAISLERLRGAPCSLIGDLVDVHARFAHGLDTVERSSLYLIGPGLEFLGFRTHAVGSVSKIFVQCYTIANYVVELGATGIILAHSHPAGIAMCSVADRKWAVSVSEWIRFLGCTLLDSVIVAGHDVCSMLAIHEPPEAFQIEPREAVDIDTCDDVGALAMSDEDRATCNLAGAIIAARQCADGPPSPEHMARIVAWWMGSRISNAIGVIALDILGCPVRCEIVGGRDLDNAAIVKLTRLAIRARADALTLVFHRPRTAIDRAKLTELAGFLSNNLACFDIGLAAVFRSGVVSDRFDPDEWAAPAETRIAIAASDDNPVK